MNNQTIAVTTANSYFKNGDLKGYRIVKTTATDLFSETGEAWMLELISKGNNRLLLGKTMDNNDIRLFKSLKSVVNTLEKIGFKVTELGYEAGK